MRPPAGPSVTGPRAPDPAAAPPLRWGVLAPGGIAATFTAAVAGHTRGRVVAVGSRSAERAQDFARRFAVPAAHGSYEQLVADPQVQAVYVASPQSRHRDDALLAIAAGKHVLVEKPFALDAAQAREVVDAAARAGVFLMEAMWTRFLPHVVALRHLVAGGEVGELVGVTADHGQWFAPGHRLFDPALGGGALLDLGVYPVSFAHALLGVPDEVRAVGQLTGTGVDGQVSMALRYGAGDGGPAAQAALHTTMWARTATTASVAGTEGRIDVDSDFYRPTSFTLTRRDGTRWRYEHPVDGGFQYQVAEVARRVADGETTSPGMTPTDTLEVMGVLDAVRAQLPARVGPPGREQG